MALTNRYITEKAAVASYDWFDFASRVGFKRFYAGGVMLSGSAAYILTDQQNTYSNWTLINTQGTTERNFDLTFQLPVIIAEGDSVMSVTTYSATGQLTRVDVIVYHVDKNGTETQIGASSSDSLTSGSTDYLRRTVQIQLVRKAFAIGEKLRLAVTHQSHANNMMWHDPIGRKTFTETASIGATLNSSLTFDVPFKIDI